MTISSPVAVPDSDDALPSHQGLNLRRLALVLAVAVAQRAQALAPAPNGGVDISQGKKKTSPTSIIRDTGEDEAETSADESRADPGTGEPEQTAPAAEGTLGRGTRRAATSTDYGGPVTRRRKAEDGEAEQTRRARRGREQDFAEISRRMYEEIRSSRDPRDHVEDG